MKDNADNAVTDYSGMQSTRNSAATFYNVVDSMNEALDCRRKSQESWSDSQKIQHDFPTEAGGSLHSRRTISSSQGKFVTAPVPSFGFYRLSDWNCHFCCTKYSLETRDKTLIFHFERCGPTLLRDQRLSRRVGRKRRPQSEFPSSFPFGST